MDRTGKNIAGAVLDEVARALGRILLHPGDLILVALSGGPDSVALLHVLLELRERFGYRLAAAHFNHRLRGAESERDEAFVCDLCARLGIEPRVGIADGLDASMGNLEERARELRHAFLRDAADEMGAAYIALAHHADDQAETVLLRLLRGTGVTGLAAMASAGPARLIRPMLALSREDIVGYLGLRDAAYVVDSSNASSAMLRNRVRNELMPTLERDYAPGLRGRLVELAGEMGELDDLIDALARNELERRLGNRGELEIASFARLHPALQSAVMRSFIARIKGDLRGVGRAHIEAMRRLSLEGPPNGRLDLPGGWRVRREYGTLLFVQRKVTEEKKPRFAVGLAVPGMTVIDQAGVLFAAELVAADSAVLPGIKSEALFDCDQIELGMVARSFTPGDRIVPIGLGGSRKVKDIFIDSKLPREQRGTFPIVALGPDIAWLPGIARGSVALVTPNTRRVLRLRAKPLVACE